MYEKNFSQGQSLPDEELGSVNGGVKLFDSADADTFSVFIKFLTGKTVEIGDLTSATSIGDLKLKIQDSEGIPPDQQRLVYSGKERTNDATLGSCGIGSGVTVHLVLGTR